MVLEEATGPMMAMAVIWAKPDGTLDIAIGPVYSYYEFRQPMSNRLTDEMWRAMLRRKTPALPKWMKKYFASKDILPEERF